MVTTAGVRTTVPKVLIKRSANPEKQNFIEYWKNDNNRATCKGENYAIAFAEEIKPSPNSTIYDFGCGTGRGGLALAALCSAKVTLVDIAPNCLDDDVADAIRNQVDYLNFLEHDLYNPLDERKKYGYAVNFIEHLNEEDFPKVIKNCLNAVERLFLVVNLTNDRNYDWWLNYLRRCEVVFYSTTHENYAATFYVSSWVDAEEIVKNGVVNIGKETEENIRVNIKRGFKQCLPHQKQDRELIILAGGSSLADHLEDIKQKRESGMGLITVNGTYKWALDNGLTPSAQVIVDGREFNKRFLSPIIPNCWYMIASQCHPSLFDDMPKEQTYIWHGSIPEELYDELNSQYPEGWIPVLGGSTVVLRSLTLFRILGYTKFHLYGFDSCLMNGAHHAYEQSENDADMIVSVALGSKNFLCTTWMVSQAQEFMAQSKAMGDEINLAVYGDGLIANILLAAIQEN